jgi:nitroreductase
MVKKEHLMATQVIDLIRRRRSIRRFRPDSISFQLLEQIVDAGRLAPTGSNIQPLEFVVVDDEELKPQVFDTLKWGRHVYPRRTPPEGKRPAAYIVVLVNKARKPDGSERDVGAAVENMILAALEQSVASCWLRNINFPKLSELLSVREPREIDSVLALGSPDEDPLMVEMKGEEYRYWLDENDRLHVPKRPLSAVLHHNGISPKP